MNYQLWFFLGVCTALIGVLALDAWLHWDPFDGEDDETIRD